MAPPEPSPSHDLERPSPRWLVLADDLTGAADTASAFRAQGYRTLLFLDPILSEAAAGIVAVNLDVREYGEGEEVVSERVRRALSFVDDRRVYLKIDSTLRGPVRTLLGACPPSPGAHLRSRHPLPPGERGACGTAWVDRIKPVQLISSEPSPPEGEGGANAGERRVRGKALICPAFPAQGRITRDGVQYAHAIPVEAVGPNGNLTAKLSEMFGLQDTLIGDAVAEEDLDGWAQWLMDRPEVLCVGSGGLAAALARRMPQSDPVPALPPVERVVILAGSTHPVTREQLEKLKTHARDDRWLILQSPSDMDGPPDEQYARNLAEAALQIGSTTVPTAWVLTGGATARCFLEAAGVKSLEVGGEVAPGIPWMIARDGRIAGSPVVTKSGGFGERNVLHEMLKFLP